MRMRERRSARIRAYHVMRRSCRIALESCILLEPSNYRVICGAYTESP
ncbi:hypothetical protein RSAG8_01491, partial [Rhizoctonia solani AG-8 WAC10335]